MHSSVILAAWAVFALVLYKLCTRTAIEIYHRQQARKLRCGQPPRMTGSGFLSLGNIKKIGKADEEKRIPQFLKSQLDETLGVDGKFGTTYARILGNPSIFTQDPKNIQAILATQFKEFGLGETRNGNFAPLLGNGIFASDGKQWEHSRALLRPQFAREQVSDLALEENHVQNMMRCLPISPDGWTDVTNIQTLFFRLTIDSATEFLFGQSVDSQLADLPGFSKHVTGAVSEKEFAYAFDRAQWGLGQAGRLGDFYWLRHNAELKKNSKICHDFIDHYVQLALNKAKAPGQSGKSRYVFIDALAESTQSPIELRNQLLNILLAGRDTTASLLSYLFMLFDKHPHVYKKLRTIILEEFGTYENPREITFSKLKSCNYLQWCLNETLRLYPIVPIDGRRALVDTTIPTGGGPDGTSPIYIRKGMPVDYSLYSMHHRKDLWGEDAEDFKPERFDGRRHGWEYLPFNGGPRICIGQQFALTEAGYVIVRLLQRFSEVVGIGNSWEPVEQGGVGYVKHKLTLTACPADGVKVKLKEARELKT